MVGGEGDVVILAYFLPRIIFQIVLEEIGFAQGGSYFEIVGKSF